MTEISEIERWLERFDNALTEQDVGAAIDLFAPECYWRDLLAFTWNIKTMEGPTEIGDMLAKTLPRITPRSWQVSGKVMGNGNPISSWISFETAAGTCEGRITLVNGKCHILMTALKDLHDYPEPRGFTRSKGLDHRADATRRTWSEKRREETARLGDKDQPYVLIIGAGQGGIALGARLKQLGVPTLIVEKNARAGDSWRNRYRSLVLHDPVWYDHMPYLEFPENWPVFTPKDKLGDWLEAYASIFELDIWTSTTCDSAHFDEATQTWTAKVTREGKTITLTPTQLIFATGAYGPPREIDLPGKDTFEGTLMHSSAYQSGADFKGKTCAVIGAASSAHDVCVDLWEAGADVTMLQRSPSVVVRSETLMELGFDIYSQAAVGKGITVDVADKLSASVPYALAPDQQRVMYKEIRKRDAAFYDRLGAAGFDYNFGEDDSGLMMKALRTASGYYIDVGASDLIADGEIKVVSQANVVGLTPDGIELEDGQQVKAEVVIACIGYQSMNETVAQIVSPEVAAAIGPCWGLGSGVPGDPGPWQGELRNMWKPTVTDNLWFHGGNLAMSRFYSRFLALQLKARMEGIETPVYGRPGPVDQSGL